MAMKKNSRHKINVLTVEDEENVRNLYVAVLGEEGHRVIAASTGAEAIKKMEKEPFDLVVLDLKLPDMHGIEILKQIKEKFNQTSVIISTAYPSLDSSVEAIRAGVYDYIIKPFSLKDLRLVIKRAVERIELIKEKEYLLKRLEERNKRLEENANELESMANAAMAREKELQGKIEALEEELKELKRI